MDPPPIKLVMVQGPRKGETLGFPPATTIRIGRVVRGNTIAIKDAGISTKHLTIEPISGKWCLRDLGSSNGTFLNSKTVSANRPLDLRDGDIVKLGEETSIQIKIDGREEDSDFERNQIKGAGEELKSRGRRTKQSQPADFIEAKDEAEGFDRASEKLGKVNSRDTRSKKVEISVVEKSQPAESIEPTGEGNGCDRAPENLGRRNTRSRKKRNSVSNTSSVLEKVPENEPVDLIETNGEAVDPENLGRRTTRSRKNENSASNSSEVNTRTTRSRKNENSVSNSSVVEKVPGRRGRPRKQNSVEEELDGKETVVEEQKVIEDAMEEESHECEVKENLEVIGDAMEEGHGCEGKENLEVIEDANEESHGCEAKENLEEELLDKEESLPGHDPVEEEQQNVGSSSGGQQNVVKETVELELEKMTLGQWFDYLECHLPKQVMEETETMIEGMRGKAERFGEYVIEQRKARDLS